MKFISLFSGIGGFDWGAMLAGHECAGFVEMDKFAHQSFEILHDPEGRLWNAYDIRSVSNESIRGLRERIGKIPFIVGGFPCQSFSIAGKREGFGDATRGTLFFEILRFASILRPQYLLLENVEGLLNHDNGETFEIVLGALDEMGYDAEWQVHNSSAYVPQNRERVFIVGHLRGVSTRKIFPFGRENSKAIEVVGRLDHYGNDQMNRVYDIDGLAPTLNARHSGNEPKIIDDQGRTTKQNKLSDVAPTLRAQSHGNEPKVLVAGHLECDSGGTGKIYDPEGIAPTQLAQHGNAVTKIIDTKNRHCRDVPQAYDICPALQANDYKEPKKVLVIGNVNPSGNGMNGQVFDAEGLGPTLTMNKGEGIKVLQRMFAGKYSVNEDITGTLQAARVDKVPMVVEEPRAVLTPDRLEKRQNGRRMKEPGEPMFTLTAQDLHGVAIIDDTQAFDGVRTYNEAPTLRAQRSELKVTDGYRIRKLTPLECFRLQSYPDWWYVILKLYRHPELIPLIDMTQNNLTEQVLTLIETHGIKEGMSDSQLYKMAGNGVTSIVAWDISSRLEEVVD
jgi:DNA (cytosine-5)-methyltransferase 1